MEELIERRAERENDVCTLSSLNLFAIMFNVIGNPDRLIGPPTWTCERSWAVNQSCFVLIMQTGVVHPWSDFQ